MTLLDDIIATTVPNQRHDWPLPVPTSWNWQAISSISSGWGAMGTGAFQTIEARDAVYRDNTSGQTLFIVVSRFDYYSYTPQNGWRLEFSEDPQGAYLGTPGTVDNPFENGKGALSPTAAVRSLESSDDPYESLSIPPTPIKGGALAASQAGTPDGIVNDLFENGKGAIQPMRDKLGNYIIEWPANRSRMLHMWAGRRHPFVAGQSAELVVVEFSVANDHGERIVAAAGTDYYQGAGHNSTRAPGAGIGKFRNVRTGETMRSAWLTVNGISQANVNATSLTSWVNATGLPSDIDDGVSMPPPVVLPADEDVAPDPADSDHFLVVTMSGTTGAEVVSIDGEQFALSTQILNYGIEFDGLTVPRIEFINDSNPPDRNVFIGSVMVDGTDIPLDHMGVTAVGEWSTEDQSCRTLRNGSSGWLHCDGYIDVHNAWLLLRPEGPNGELPPPPVIPETAEPVDCECTDDDLREWMHELGIRQTLNIMLEVFDV